MQVIITQTTLETGNGFNVEHFIKGKTYDVRDYLGYNLIQANKAEVVSW